MLLPPLTRRRALRLAGMSAIAGLMPLSALAARGAQTRRFLFVVADGGWDPLAVFAPMFQSPDIDMGEQTQLGSAGGLEFVDHPDRPAVRRFYQDYGAQSAVINGVSVPSVSHDICRVLAMTGSSAGERADWPSIIGASTPSYTTPSLVLAGPSYPADLGVYSARVGASGQLSGLLTGSMLESAEPAVQGRLRHQNQAINQALLAREQRSLAATASGQALRDEFSASNQRLAELHGLSDSLDFSATYDQASRFEVAVQALSSGLCRCVTTTADGAYGVWDSHNDNETVQSLAFETLFSGLLELMALLESTQDPDGEPLSASTTVVLLSEMGRTPRYNAGGGRDHWPYTSAMLIGGGIPGGQVIGGHDDAYFGLGIDPVTGAVDRELPSLSMEHVGATLLRLADVDPAEFLPAVSPIQSLLS